MKTVLAVIGIIKNKEGNILLTKRHEPDREFHGYWHLPGGAVDDLETPEVAIVRELKEELGIKTTVVSMLPQTFTKFRNNKEWKGVFLIFHVQMTPMNQKITLNEEASEYGWFPLHEVRNMHTLPLTSEILKISMHV